MYSSELILCTKNLEGKTDFFPDYQTFGNIMLESSYNNYTKQHTEK